MVSVAAGYKIHEHGLCMMSVRIVHVHDHTISVENAGSLCFSGDFVDDTMFLFSVSYSSFHLHVCVLKYTDDYGVYRDLTWRDWLVRCLWQYNCVCTYIIVLKASSSVRRGWLA